VPLALKGHDKACRSRACRSTLALGDHSGTGWPPSKRKPRAMVLIQGKKAAKENDGEKNASKLQRGAGHVNRGFEETRRIGEHAVRREDGVNQQAGELDALSRGHALTHRERQIMRLVSEGMSNKEIGRQLNITDGTN
jgi:ATP/maltotriose-dependent transcriptional regulator MalT